LSLPDHPATVSNLAFSPSGKFLVTVADRLVRVWEGSGWSSLKKELRANQTVSSVFWIDDDHLATATLEPSVILWSLPNGEAIYRWLDARSNAVLYDTATDVLFMSFNESVLVGVKLATKQEYLRVEMPDSRKILSLDIDASELLIGLSSGEACLVNTTTGSLIRQYSGAQQTKYIVRCGFAGVHKSLIVSGSEFGRIVIWHRARGQVIKTVKVSEKHVSTVLWHPEYSVSFVVLSDDPAVTLWASKS
jgi:WD40 repeat protein